MASGAREIYPTQARWQAHIYKMMTPAEGYDAMVETLQELAEYPNVSEGSMVSRLVADCAGLEPIQSAKIHTGLRLMAVVAGNPLEVNRLLLHLASLIGYSTPMECIDFAKFLHFNIRNGEAPILNR